MAGYINRKEAILACLDSPISSNGLISSSDALKRLADLPVADVSPVVHGRWEVSDTPCERFKCSECGGGCWYYDYHGDVAKSRYCPSCGAKMDKEASKPSLPSGTWWPRSSLRTATPSDSGGGRTGTKL